MKISILGLGAMGARMAARCVAAGHQVTTWNRSTRRVDGAGHADRPQDAAAASEIVVSMLTDDDAGRAVWLDNGGLIGLAKGALFIDMSTVSPEWSSQLQAAVLESGARFIAAPVVGTRPHAEKGELTILAGGDATDIAQATELWSCLGRLVILEHAHTAITAKLAINALFAGQVALLSEALGLLRTAGLTTDQGLRMLEPTPVFAPILVPIAGLLRAGDDAPRFPVDLVAKDLRYAANQADLPVLRAVQRQYERASKCGLGDRNIQAVCALYTDA